MAEQGYTPTEADQQRAREALAGLLVEYSDTDGPVTSYTTGPADGDEDAVLNLAERFAEVRADERAKTQEMKDYGDRAVHKLNQARFDLRDERAKRPDREQIARIQFEIDNVHQIHGETCLCGFKSSRSRSRTEHLTALFADAVLALEPETDQELQDRIEVLEKNLAYEVAQKIKLAEQLQAATTTSLTLEQARWKMHAGIDSRCSEEVAAKAKPVIDLVLSSLALEPEAREYKLEHLAAVTNINSITKAMLEEVGYPSHFHPADAPSWAYSVLEEEHEERTAPEAREELKLSGILARAEEVRQDDGWCIGGAWGDYGEVVVPIRILSYVIEGELDQKIASTDPGFALTYAEQERRAEEAEAKLAEAREVTDAEVNAILHHRWDMMAGTCACGEWFGSEPDFTRHALEAARKVPRA